MSISTSLTYFSLSYYLAATIIDKSDIVSIITCKSQNYDTNLDLSEYLEN